MKSKTLTTGIIQLLLSCIFFAILGWLVKVGHSTFSSFQMAFARSIVNFLIVFVILFFRRSEILQPKPISLLIRSVAGLLSLIFYFISLTKLKLSDAISINYSLPVVIGLFLFIVARPRPSIINLALSVMGFSGVLVILKPELGFFNVNGIWGLVSLGFMTIAFITLHQIANKYDPEVIVFYFTGVASLFLLPAVLDFRVVPDFKGWMILVGIGLSATAGQAFMTRGYAKVPLVVASQLQLTTIVFSAVLGWALLREELKWNFYLGSLVVIISSLILIPRNSQAIMTLPWQSKSTNRSHNLS